MDGDVVSWQKMVLVRRQKHVEVSISPPNEYQVGSNFVLKTGVNRWSQGVVLSMFNKGPSEPDFENISNTSQSFAVQHIYGCFVFVFFVQKADRPRKMSSAHKINVIGHYIFLTV